MQPSDCAALTSAVDAVRATSLYDCAACELCRATAADTTAAVRIYFARNSHQLLSEQEAYDLTSLLSDIGGQVGLWLGISILSLAEAVLFGAMLVAITWHKVRDALRRRKQVHAQIAPVQLYAEEEKVLLCGLN